MEVMTTFDALGRLTLPVAAVAQFGLDENSRLLIAVIETEKRLLLRPTQEMPPVACVMEMERMQAVMLLQPAGTWRYIRALDDRRRVILLRPMREWLGWAGQSRRTCASARPATLSFLRKILINAKQLSGFIATDT